jgi:hypothetical protein
MPDPHLRIMRRIADEPYGWTASYRASLIPGRIALTLRLQLQPRPGVTSAGLTQVRRETEKAVAQYFDCRFLLEEGSGRQQPVRVSVEFVTSDPDLSVAVHAGSGRDNLQHWFVNSGVIARAHEVGHAFGLKDEYVDPLAANRATTGAAGVYADHSLMGDFQQEGTSLAELKPRHALEMVRGLGAHLGDNSKVTPSGAAGEVFLVQTGSETTNARSAAGSIQALRELAQRLDAHCPGEGHARRLHR